jgi:hypothetical protein
MRRTNSPTHIEVTVEVNERLLLLPILALCRSKERKSHRDGIQALNYHAFVGLKRFISVIEYGQKKRICVPAFVSLPKARELGPRCAAKRPADHYVAVLSSVIMIINPGLKFNSKGSLGGCTMCPTNPSA